MENSKNKQLNVNVLSFAVIVACFGESIYAILQYTETLDASNKYFKLLGSFTSPNFLGGYISLGISILIWLFFVKSLKQKSHKMIIILCLLLFTCILLLSNSRASWLAVLSSSLFLLATSIKVKIWIRKSSIVKKAALFLSLLFIVFYGAKFLYALKPASAQGRLVVANITIQEIIKQPFKGYGLFSFAGGYNSAKAAYFMESERAWEEVQNATYVFTAFNDYLLLAYEIGIIPLLTILLFFTTLLFKTKINTYSRLGLALLLNVSVLALFTSPLASIPIMLLGLLGAAITVSFGDFKKVYSQKNKRLTFYIRMAVFFLGITGVYASSSKFIGMKNLHSYYVTHKDSIVLEEILPLAKHKENHGFSDANLGRALYRSGYQKEAIYYLKKAFEITSAPKIGKSLASYLIKEGDHKRVEEIYKLNIGTEFYRYEARMDLLNLYIKTNRSKDVAILAQEIIDFPVKIPSKKIDHYKKKASSYIAHYRRFNNSTKNLKGSLSEGKIIKSEVLGKKLAYKIYLPSLEKITHKLPVIYINDGYSYINKGKLPSLLDSLIEINKIPPMAAVFLDPKDGYQNWKNIRQELFLCNSKFVEFFTQELIPSIEKKYPISNLREDRSILGVSFGGLAAAYIGFEATEYFQNIIMQSPAFHPCRDLYRSYAKNGKKDLKMYLSYGTGKDTEKQDLPMLEILENKEYELKVERIEGGDHNWKVWKPQLEHILMWFFKKDP